MNFVLDYFPIIGRFTHYFWNFVSTSHIFRRFSLIELIRFHFFVQSHLRSFSVSSFITRTTYLSSSDNVNALVFASICSSFILSVLVLVDHLIFNFVRWNVSSIILSSRTAICSKSRTLLLCLCQSSIYLLVFPVCLRNFVRYHDPAQVRTVSILSLISPFDFVSYFST